ncbi:Hypothetical protein UVM_LOCUS52 [uncultured virus]|nr:Hypothetical protein UVM_LOCUS52 [uncultured virus]
MSLQLPDELWLRVLSFLDPCSLLGSVSLTSSALRLLADDRALWMAVACKQGRSPYVSATHADHLLRYRYHMRRLRKLQKREHIQRRQATFACFKRASSSSDSGSSLGDVSRASLCVCEQVRLERSFPQQTWASCGGIVGCGPCAPRR